MTLFVALLSVFLPHSLAVASDTDSVAVAVETFFQDYCADNYRHFGTLAADSFRVDTASKTLTIYCNEAFSSQSLTQSIVDQAYRTIRQQLPQDLRDYSIALRSNRGYLIDELVPFSSRSLPVSGARVWESSLLQPAPWVKNVSRPLTPYMGLNGRHLYIYPSHGRYFDGQRWKWQRPSLYSTTEDLLTQSIVYPFLFPMLENAGAIVYSARERDTQTSEVVVDNDQPATGGAYKENSESGRAWHTMRDQTGFRHPDSLLTDQCNPFTQGSVRFARSTSDSIPSAYAIWQPSIPKEGDYAVYVSYATHNRSISDAHYSVHHAGGTTHFLVNQQMGGSTWVYLGTFHFMQGTDDDGYVILTNESRETGIVTADAVRFGGGMGNISRGAAGCSSFPRFLEAARYQAQWCGAPDSVYYTEHGRNDYNDDLRVRANMVNWLGGGSTYQPYATGKKVPFELALAIHSDAGTLARDKFFGTLAICTTQPPADSLAAGHSGLFESGQSRLMSHDLADILKNSIATDLQRYGLSWPMRETWDRNYAETRMPHLPSAIIETLSHQNFRDMSLAHTPQFKFALARSLYKGILHYVYASHEWGEPVVQPLPVSHFSAVLTEAADSVVLSWQPTVDSLEASAVPTDYIVYTSHDMQGLAFDNGFPTQGATRLTLPLQPGRQYNFRVTASNAGGESFPSETLSVYRSSRPRGQILLVDAFTQLSGPAVVCSGDSLGVDLQTDPGVPYHSSWAFSGQQTKFTQPRADINSGLERTGDELRGNYFNQSALHCHAIAEDGRYHVSSTSVRAAESLDWQRFQLVDYFAGLSYRQANAPVPSAAFTSAMQKKIDGYTQHGGHVFASGMAVGSDMQSEPDRDFLHRVFFCQFDRINPYPQKLLTGLSTTFEFNLDSTSVYPPLPRVDELLPISSESFCFITYANGHSAGVAAQTASHNAALIGFPFCSLRFDQQADFMHALLSFLLVK